MKIIICFLIIVVLFFYMSNTSISFNPFSIKCKSLALGFSMLFIVLAITCLQYHYYEKGHADAIKEINEIIHELVQK